VIIRDPTVLQSLRSGQFNLGAKATATVLRSGAAAGLSFEKGIGVVIDPLRGAMVNASITGQRIRLTM
jgi:hypothetical protein